MAVGLNCSTLVIKPPNAGQWACKMLQVADGQGDETLGYNA